MSGGQKETPARGAAQPGHEGRFATAAGLSNMTQTDAERKVVPRLYDRRIPDNLVEFDLGSKLTGHRSIIVPIDRKDGRFGRRVGPVGPAPFPMTTAHAIQRGIHGDAMSSVGGLSGFKSEALPDDVIYGGLRKAALEVHHKDLVAAIRVATVLGSMVSTDIPVPPGIILAKLRIPRAWSCADLAEADLFDMARNGGIRFFHAPGWEYDETDHEAEGQAILADWRLSWIAECIAADMNLGGASK